MYQIKQEDQVNFFIIKVIKSQTQNQIISQKMNKSKSCSRMPSRSMSEIKIKINTALGNKNVRQVQISKKQQHQFLIEQKKFMPNRVMSSKSLTQKCMTQKFVGSNQKFKKVPYAYTKNKNIILAHSLINVNNKKNSSHSSSKPTNRPSLASSSIKEEITKSNNRQNQKYEQLQMNNNSKYQGKTSEQDENFNSMHLIDQKNVIWFHAKDFPIQFVQKTVSKLKLKNQKQQLKKQHISYFQYQQILTPKSKQMQNKHFYPKKQQTQFQNKTQAKVIASFQGMSIKINSDCNMSLQDQKKIIFLVKRTSKNSLKIQEISLQSKKNKDIVSLSQCRYVMITSKNVQNIEKPQKILKQFMQLKNDGVETFQVINKILNRTLRQKLQQKIKQTQRNQTNNSLNFGQIFVLIFQVFLPSDTKGIVNSTTNNKTSQTKKISTAEIIQKKLTSFKMDQLTKRKLLFN